MEEKLRIYDNRDWVIIELKQTLWDRNVESRHKTSHIKVQEPQAENHSSNE